MEHRLSVRSLAARANRAVDLSGWFRVRTHGATHMNCRERLNHYEGYWLISTVGGRPDLYTSQWWFNEYISHNNTAIKVPWLKLGSTELRIPLGFNSVFYDAIKNRYFLHFNVDFFSLHNDLYPVWLLAALKRSFSSIMEKNNPSLTVFPLERINFRNSIFHNDQREKRKYSERKVHIWMFMAQCSTDSQ